MEIKTIALALIILFIEGCGSSANPYYKQIKRTNTNQRVLLRQTPHGALILAAKNESKLGTKGELTLIFGNYIYKKWEIPSLVGMINLYQLDTKGESLSIVNTSIYNVTPITLQFFSPEYTKTSILSADGISKKMKHRQAFQIDTDARLMKLEVKSPGDFAVILIYQATKPIVYLLNASTIDKKYYYDKIQNIDIIIKEGNSVVIEKLFHGDKLLIANLSPKPTKNISIRLTCM